MTASSNDVRQAESTGGPRPPDVPPPAAPPPAMALRTYRFLRLGAVGVIAILAVSLITEYHRAGDCLQGSISAYYYTAVQSVFVGALVALGLVMIALWGKTPLEDSFLNLAGMLAPVVAFVPTAKTNKCGLTTVAGGDVTSERQKADVIEASHDAVFNNMLTYLIVIGIALLAFLVVGVIAHRTHQWPSITNHPLAYWVPWGAASALWVLAVYSFTPDHRMWFYDNAHKISANVLFVFIGAAVIDIGFQKWRGPTYVGEPKSGHWARVYWGLAGLMAVGGVLIYVFASKVSDTFGDHRTFWLEAWEIALLALFWGLQTWDRWTDGAPPNHPTVKIP